MDSRVWYTGLVALVAAARLGELALSAANARRLIDRGAVEFGASHYPYMVALHTSFLVACPLEVWLLRRAFFPALAAGMLALLVATFALRYWVIATLRDRWSTRVLVPPNAALVASGPYRFFRHPNYIAVTLELPALALIHTAWLTAATFSVLNAIVLAKRIAVEDAALGRVRAPARSPRSSTPRLRP